MTALLEHIDGHFKIIMNDCCVDVGGHLLDNARIFIPCIIAALYSFICIELCILIRI